MTIGEGTYRNEYGQLVIVTEEALQDYIDITCCEDLDGEIEAIIRFEFDTTGQFILD